MLPRLTPLLALALLVSLSGCLSLVTGQVIEEAEPAIVTPEGLDRAGYVELNRTSVVVRPPVPLVGEVVGLRAWVAGYASSDALMAGDAGEPAVDEVDVSSASLVLLVSTSAAERGPVALNPLVYAADPALLEQSGVLVEVADQFVSGDLVDLSVEGSEPVTMLGTETTVTKLSGRIVAEDGTSAQVSVAVTRVVHEGDVVVLVGVTPADEDAASDLVALAPRVVHGPDVPRE